MDSQVQVEGRLLDLVTDDWRKERLPLDDINVPVSEFTFRRFFDDAGQPVLMSGPNAKRSMAIRLINIYVKENPSWSSLFLI